MSSGHTVQIDEQIRSLERARDALERALAEAKNAGSKVDESLTTARGRIIDATRGSVAAPDAAIAERIVDVAAKEFESLIAMVRRHWSEIRQAIGKLLNRIMAELEDKRRLLRRLEAAGGRARGGDGGDGGSGASSGGSTGTSAGGGSSGGSTGSS